MSRRDRGSAVVEFVVLAVVLSVPITSGLAAIVRIHTGRLAAQSAASAAALAVARDGGGLATADKVVHAHWDEPVDLVTTLACEPWCGQPGGTVTVTVHLAVPVPPWPGPVSLVQSHTQVVDRYAAS